MENSIELHLGERDCIQSYSRSRPFRGIQSEINRSLYLRPGCILIATRNLFAEKLPRDLNTDGSRFVQNDTNFSPCFLDELRRNLFGISKRKIDIKAFERNLIFPLAIFFLSLSFFLSANSYIIYIYIGIIFL